MGNYRGRAGNDIYFGSSKADFIYGNGGNDELHGGGGNDQVYGGDGSDTLYGDGGNDSLYGDAGNDEIWGGDGDDGLSGGTGDDVLHGGTGGDGLNGAAGNDILSGEDGNDFLGLSAGNDSLTGGAGADTFRLAQQSDQGAGSTTLITDFIVGEDYFRGQSHWDANASLLGEQRWEYIGSDAPTSALANGNGQATYTYENGNTVLRLYNNDGDLNADTVIAFQGLYDRHDLQINLFDVSTDQYSDFGIIF